MDSAREEEEVAGGGGVVGVVTAELETATFA
jgi:hypothetical protein